MFGDGLFGMLSILVYMLRQSSYDVHTDLAGLLIS